MVTQIDHIELIVNDVQAYVDLFTMLGFKIVTQTDHHGGSVELQLPGPNQPVFEIHKTLVEEVPGVNHIALRVTDVNEAYEKIKEKGLRIDMAPHYSPHTGRTNMNARDPDGWRLQICDAKRIDPESEEAKAKAKQ